jgi:hypothetical protein
MTNKIVTTEFTLERVPPPNLPLAPVQYDSRYHESFNNILRLYFNRLDNFLAKLMADGTSIPVTFPGMEVDAFGRLRVSNPFSLFDSQNRYGKDPQFDESTATGGTSTYLPNESSVQMAVTTTSGSEVVRQTYRVFPYQPGKSLLVLATFVMDAGKTNLLQQAGYFNDDNGVFFQKTGTTNQFVLRSNITGTPSDARTVDQADWNGDKLDGTGESGFTLDTSKAQILFLDFEWLGVGSVRCGFVINGQYIICHTFENANDITSVYMTTAILPIRYRIKATNTLSGSASMKQICASVISEGGYEQATSEQFARQNTVLGSISTTFLPLVSIRLNASSLGAVVLPQSFQVLPITNQNYEVALVKNTTLTAASWNTTTFNNVDYDVSATAMSGGTIVQQQYVTSSAQGRATVLAPTGYNFDLQLGVSLAGVSDIYTVAIRTVSGATSGSAVGALAFIDLTD